MPLFLVPWRYDEQFAFYTDTKFRGSNPSSSAPYPYKTREMTFFFKPVEEKK
jgi:hypothetical protein